jgi:pyruvate carboxylase subunit B
MLPEGTFIHFHTHETAGISVAAYQAALDAGADAIDLSMAPASGGTCQPDILVMWHALRGTNYTLDVDIDKVREAEEIFKECMQDYFLPPEATAVEPLIPWSPMPGGALTANTQMLRDNNIMDKYPDMIRAMSDVVKKGGYGTSVTPVSQFYFQQAFNNVMFGPWKKIAEPYGQMVLGYFGKTPVPPDPEIVKLAAEQLEMEPTTRPPLEINDADPKKGVEAARKMLQGAGLPETDENLFIAATCKEKGLAFLKGEAEVGVRKIKKETKPAPVAAVSSRKADEPAEYTVSVNGKEYFMAFEGNVATVNGKVYRMEIRQEGSEGKSSAGALTEAVEATPVAAQMPGKVLRVMVKAGQRVKEGDSLLVLEAMKMEVQVSSPVSGTVCTVSVSAGDQVNTGQVLASIS